LQGIGYPLQVLLGLTLAIVPLRAATQDHPAVPESRFQRMAPCPSVSSVWIDRYGSGIGLACETARNKHLQGRVLWIDATANINQYNTPEKIQVLMDHVADSGFNTVVFDIKPISGQTVYPSKYAPKLLEWRGQSLPAGFDPVPGMVEAAHAKHLSIILSMNAFSEGHRLFKTGPGYAQPEHQTVLYVPNPVVRIGESSFGISASVDQVAEEKITVLSSVLKAKAGGYWVILDAQQTVRTNSESANPPTIPGQTILFGTGKAAEFLRARAKVGSAVVFDTEPTYLPISAEPGGQIPLIMNLNDPEVQDHALTMIREVVEKYPADGVIYDDRLRYAGMDGDFSEITRTKFEQFVGHPLHWPDDVFKYTFSKGLSKGIRPGRYYDLWMSWRPAQIQDFVKRVRETVKQARPTAQFGAYVGSWYGDYPALGHNYASTEAAPGFWFENPRFESAGTAGLLDYLMVGCYYPTATIYEAMEKGIGPGYTVEAGGALCNRLVRDETWVYAGIDCGAFVDNPSGLANLVQAACASTQGVMVFDLSHGLDKLWPTFKQIFAQPAPPPHLDPANLAQLRAHRKVVDSFHQKERPIIILNGSSGVGQ
jgi:uncharacterized lipoprotein YddW (UPF0748 family)